MRYARVRQQLAEMTRSRISRRDLNRSLTALGLGAPLGWRAVTPAAASAQEEAASHCPAENVELLYMTHSHDPAIVVNDQLIQEFQALHPNVQIVYDHAPHENYEQKVLTAFAGGQGPDVFWAGDWMLPQFTASGILAPVDPAAYGVASTEEFVQLYEAGALTPFMDGDNVLTGGISEYNTFSMIYNPRHFEDAGLPLPSSTEPMTWEEFADYAEQLTIIEDGTRVRSGVEWVYNTPIWTVLLFEPMLHQIGGQVINPDTGQPDFTSPEMIRVMQFVQDLRMERQANDPAFLVDLLDDFANDRVSMIVAGPWAIPALESINPDAPFAVAPLPVFAEGERITTLYAWAWFVNAGSAPTTQCWAWEFLDFLTANGKLWWDEVGYIQPRTDEVDGQTLSEYQLSTMPELEVFLDDYEYGQYQFRSTDYFEISSAWNRAFQRIMEGEDVEQVLSETQAAFS
jgi:multiple sugar transport system substrate-binding protein